LRRQRAASRWPLRHDLQHCRHWQRAFASQHKDHRYYEIVEDALHSEFDYRYFVIRNARRDVTAIQPFFILDLDILVGTHPRLRPLIDAIRAVWRGSCT